MTTPTIAVTGLTGFVGQSLCPALLEAGYTVRALVRNPARVKHISHPNLTWHSGSLEDDLSDFVAGCETVVHIAGVIKGRTRADYFRINADATGDLAKAAEQAGVTRFVLMSSISARCPELSDYAASKFAGEERVREDFSGKLAIVRASPVFGPGDEATKPFFDALKYGILPVPGGRNWRERRLSLVYVKDLVSCLTVHALKGDYDGQTVSPATIPDMTWHEFAGRCADAVEKPIRPVPLPLSLLYPFAGLTSVSSRLLGIGHFTLGKLREFLYPDWHSADVIQHPTDLNTAIRDTVAAYANPSKTVL